MALLGDLDHVEKMLRATVGSDLGDDVTDRLSLIRAAISARLEDLCGRTFGSPVEDTTEIVWAGPFETILLPRPARSITSVTSGGTVSGTTYTGGSAITGFAYAPYDAQRGLIYGLTRTTGSWWAWGDPYGAYGARQPVEIVGDFSDSDADSDVPDDVTYAANLLIAEQFKRENASPAGFSGPTGDVIPMRDPWNDPFVKQVIERYSATASVMAI
jgi:hypothetical protein